MHLYLTPAIAYKDEIIKESDKLRYSDSMMFYNGCMEHGRIYIHDDYDDGGKYQWAIVDKHERLVGYIAYNVNHFSRAAYSFGLIAFREDPEAIKAMAMGIRHAIKHLEAMRLHRIEFRAISDNPACTRYLNIMLKWSKKHGYVPHTHYLRDVFKDEYGIYHGCILFEVIEENCKKGGITP